MCRSHIDKQDIHKNTMEKSNITVDEINAVKSLNQQLKVGQCVYGRKIAICV